MTQPPAAPPSVTSAPHRVVARFVYGIYTYCMFLVLGLTALFGMALPGLERRRGVARRMSRMLLLFTGMPLVVKNLDRIPAGQCVVVANHASYLDGVVMTAALPPRFGFVIKREMERVPLAGALLRRLGSEFVERFNRNRGGVDARRVLRTAVSGSSLVFFPEGTFEPRPGLGKFHAGAFTIAARAGCPVVPAVVRGTRRALPPLKLWPHPGRIEIEFLEPIVAVSDTPDAVAVELRDRARAAILEGLCEPDLAAERAAAA
ncbi:MAG: lysophospholipid acyltransferase family protein [Gammaproteobacteria bacterium]